MHAITTTTVTNTGFDVLDVSLEWIEALRPVVQRIQLCDADLARQLRKAASKPKTKKSRRSVPMVAQLAEILRAHRARMLAA